MFLKPVFPWATEGNYPAGSSPWNGQPISVVPVGDYFTPNTKPPAQYFNFLLASNAVQSALLQSYVISATLENWCPEFKVDSSSSPCAVAWDPYLNYYLLLDLNGTAVVLTATKGLDQASLWTPLTTLTASPNAPVYGACCVDGTIVGQYYVAYTDTGKNLYVWNYASGSWTGEFNSATGNPASLYGVELATLGSGVDAFVFVAFASTDSHSGIIYSNIVVGWPSSSSWPPAANFVPFGITAMNAGDTVYLKSNGAQVVCIPGTTASGGSLVWQTTNGTTWTSSTSLAALLPGGAKVVGLCWTQDAQGLCWLAAAQYGGGGQVHFYRSADGITWTAQSGGLVNTIQQVADMEAAGSHVVCTFKDFASTVPSTLPGAMFSVDGGITWFPSQLTLSTNTSSSSSNYNHNRPRIASSSIGFVVANGIWTRISQFAGLPPGVL